MNELLPILRSDSELIDLVNQNLQTIAPENLYSIIKAHEKYNLPMYLKDNEGNYIETHNFRLKRLLDILPSYFDKAKLGGLENNQAQHILLRLLSSSPFDLDDKKIRVINMTRALENITKKANHLDGGELKLLEQLFNLAHQYHTVDDMLYSYYALSRIGFSTLQSTKLISQIIEVNRYASPMIIRPFNLVLRTLFNARIEPESLNILLNRIYEKKGIEQVKLYQSFENIITFGCPSLNSSPQEIIDRIVNSINSGEDIEYVFEDFKYNKSEYANSTSSIVYTEESMRSTYFMEKIGSLELAALPYQTEKTLNDGIRDLEKIALASSDDGDEVGEGFWVYDNGSQRWYSLGGQLEIKPEALRHNMIPYDISGLSENPKMFHCHPKDYEILLKPIEDQTIYPTEFSDYVLKFLTSTPSEADYNLIVEFINRADRKMDPSSYIVHSIGITEFTYPKDVEALNEMASISRALRDEVLIEFDWNSIKKEKLSIIDLTIKLMELLNEKLPEGFSLRFYPHNYDF